MTVNQLYMSSLSLLLVINNLALKLNSREVMQPAILLRKIALPYPHKCLVWFCGAKASTDEFFNKDFSCREVTPLSANICACADIVDESNCLETLHYIFGRTGSNIVYFFYHYD